MIKSGAARTLHEDVNYGNERGYQTVRTIGSIHIADDCARVIDNAEASRFLFSVRFNSCRLALRVVVAARAERFCPMKGPAARRLGGANHTTAKRKGSLLMSVLKSAAFGLAISLIGSFFLQKRPDIFGRALKISEVDVGTYHIFWSWPIFVVAALGAWMISKGINSARIS